MALNPQVITVREHERVNIGKRWDPKSRTLDEEAAARIFEYQDRTGKRLFEPVYKGFKATQWVGAIGLGRRCLEVIPKIDDPRGTLDERQTRENLFWMVARAGLVPIAPADISRLSDPSRPLLLAFLDLFVEQLTFEWQRGPIKQYVSEEENRSFLRGKLIFPQQLKHNFVHRQRFFTQADEFTMDNPPSRLLKAALRLCSAQSFSHQIARRARALLLEFDEISDQEFSDQEADTITVSRQHFRFSLLVSLARLIIRSKSPDSAGLGEPVFTLMFDMNVVFEKFVAAEIALALAGTRFSVIPQLGGRSLLKENGKARFHLRPDIGVLEKDQVICLIDTKWKRLDPEKPNWGVSQADIYQMYAYGKEYRSTLTILLYPRFGKLKANMVEYLHSSEFDQQRSIMVSTIDISNLMKIGSKWLNELALISRFETTSTLEIEAIQL